MRAAPEGPWVIEICNTCNGLVGWSKVRDGCCLGGMVCRRLDGTRMVSVTPDTPPGVVLSVETGEQFGVTPAPASIQRCENGSE